jgi:hypothetical protein
MEVIRMPGCTQLNVRSSKGGTGKFLVMGEGSDKFSLTSNVTPEKLVGGDITYQAESPWPSMKAGSIGLHLIQTARIF